MLVAHFCLHAGSEMKELVEAWHDVKKKQHVNLDARVKEITLEGLCTSCIPSSVPTDKLATLKAAEIDKGVAKPFPFIEIGEFMPPWAAVVRVVHSISHFSAHSFLSCRRLTHPLVPKRRKAQEPKVENGSICSAGTPPSIALQSVLMLHRSAAHELACITSVICVLSFSGLDLSCSTRPLASMHECCG